MANFPSSLKPVISSGYSFSGQSSVIKSPASGGLPLQARDLKFGPVPFNIAINVNPTGLQVFQDFYADDIFSGSGRFNMDLDSGLGVESHVVQIEAGSLSIDGGSAPKWVISFVVLAESTPVQNGIVEE